MTQSRVYAIPGVRAHIYTPHTSVVTPRASVLTPRASVVTPRASFVTPRASLVIPQALIVTPQAPVVTPKKNIKKYKKNVGFVMEDPVKKLSILLDLTGLTPAEKAMRIPLWHRIEQRKIAGTAAPIRKNLAKHLKRNKLCDVFVGQNKFDMKRPGEIDDKTGRVVSGITRVTIWNSRKMTKITGNAAPLPKNLGSYFAKHPEMELYNGQDLWLKCLGETNSWEQVGGIDNYQVRKDGSPPGAHYALMPDAAMQTEIDWLLMSNDEPPKDVFCEKHQDVPGDYCAGDIVCMCISSGPANHTEISMCPDSSHSVPVEDGYPIVGTFDSEPNDADNVCYENMASSWSNSPLWTDPNCTYRLEPRECFITPLQADRSLAFEDSPLDLTIELQDFSIIPGDMVEDIFSCSDMEDAEKAEEDIAALSFEGPELSFEENDLPFGNFLVDDPAENARKMKK